MKRIVITQSNYIPWKGYFDAIALADEFVIYDDMQFTRRDWRNRNIIKTPNGNKWLTIPVEVKGKYFQKINEAKISDKDWNKNHWNIIKNNYSKSQNFADYKDLFEELYLNCNSIYLTEINYRFIVAICELLQIKSNIRFSSEFELKEERSERLLDICLNLEGTDYYSGPAAKAYMNEQVFTEAGVKVHYFDYSNYPEYKQLHDPFEHYVSILDLIFCEGKSAVKFLKIAEK
ncbi:WbqC family protein [Flavobacterium saccharophilum]|uniref:WbqC-like protein family protein n=1 Tax=Flavobacterium saccharophilum TaxID=29534 RepID=A0A1M7K8A4_9FLAO|nr:WbqC family protein [Flavobacterium saccharophilum]SHM61510.1 WbqC-like protein family protein [Flavobacterium saccharophilum]